MRWLLVAVAAMRTVVAADPMIETSVGQAGFRPLGDSEITGGIGPVFAFGVVGLADRFGIEANWSRIRPENGHSTRVRALALHDWTVTEPGGRLSYGLRVGGGLAVLTHERREDDGWIAHEFPPSRGSSRTISLWNVGPGASAGVWITRNYQRLSLGGQLVVPVGVHYKKEEREGEAYAGGVSLVSLDIEVRFLLRFR